MITVALTKGRLFKDFIKYINEQGLSQYTEALEDEGRSLYTEINNIRFIFAKGKDVPLYVESGVADLGIAGLDILVEDPADVLNVSALPFGECRLAIAGPPGIQKIEKVATSFTEISFRYFTEQKQDVEILHLHGSVELAPILGLSDAIVDIVQTGTTLKENGLIEYDKIMDIQARLIANKQTFYTKEEEIYNFIKQLGVF
ncbi:MAG: ATP phosphoribosyltransferase [Atopococcus tabaci]|uniref:ATP phosphoribosyltransferase n=1 Tax=Atopococcus tabaci TaxID=269774 RepID=A0AA43UC75_9LACT|nr:ATP phosphoribosyltransferase [Atopococcus tabaci]